MFSENQGLILDRDLSTEEKGVDKGKISVGASFLILTAELKGKVDRVDKMFKIFLVDKMFIPGCELNIHKLKPCGANGSIWGYLLCFDP